MIELNKITLFSQAKKELPVFYQLSARFNTKERIGIYGQSGSGKTALAKLLSSVITANQGFIVKTGRCSWPVGITHIFHAEVSVLDNLKFICELSNVEFEYCISFFLLFTQLQSVLQLPFKKLTPSQKSLTGFAIALAIPQEWYIVDTKMTIGSKSMIERCQFAWQQRLADSGLVFISSNVRQLKQFCEKFYLLAEGSLIPVSSPEEAQHSLLQHNKNQK